MGGSTLFRDLQRVPCGILTVPEVPAKTMSSGHVYPRLTSSMHKQGPLQTTSFFKVLFSNSLLELALKSVGLVVHKFSMSRLYIMMPKGDPWERIVGWGLHSCIR